MKRLLLVVLGLVLFGAFAVWDGRTAEEAAEPPVAADPAWSELGPQARCDEALALVTHPDRWPIRCRWRTPGDPVQGQAFPPPAGAPPFDDPRVEIYVEAGQTREELASVIAHELGHMHHTREVGFFAEWLAARNLPPGTPPETWTEDYAEVFASLFGPPSERWRAPTPRPSPEALDALKARFFS